VGAKPGPIQKVTEFFGGQGTINVNSWSPDSKRFAYVVYEVLPEQRASNSNGHASNIDILTDTQGLDFGPYLSRVVENVRQNWFSLIPKEARAPQYKKGMVAIEFAILKDGRVSGMKLEKPSGDVAMDRAAWGGITASNPFVPLPDAFHGPYLGLRFRFYYNPERSEVAEK
jgi:TonB family protein